MKIVVSSTPEECKPLHKRRADFMQRTQEEHNGSALHHAEVLPIKSAKKRSWMAETVIIGALILTSVIEVYRHEIDNGFSVAPVTSLSEPLEKASPSVIGLNPDQRMQLFHNVAKAHPLDANLIISTYNEHGEPIILFDQRLLKKDNDITTRIEITKEGESSIQFSKRMAGGDEAYRFEQYQFKDNKRYLTLVSGVKKVYSEKTGKIEEVKLREVDFEKTFGYTTTLYPLNNAIDESLNVKVTDPLTSAENVEKEG